MDSSASAMAQEASIAEASQEPLWSLSGHDSTPWTFDASGRAFGERYRTLRVGEEVRIDASTGSADASPTELPPPPRRHW